MTFITSNRVSHVIITIKLNIKLYMIESYSHEPIKREQKEQKDTIECRTAPIVSRVKYQVMYLMIIIRS
jgi:hypothetical protein